MAGATSLRLLRQRRRTKSMPGGLDPSVGPCLLPALSCADATHAFAVCTFPPPYSSTSCLCLRSCSNVGAPASRWVYVLARQHHVFPDLPPCASACLFVCLFCFCFFVFLCPSNPTHHPNATPLLPSALPTRSPCWPWRFQRSPLLLSGSRGTVNQSNI